MRSKYKYPTGGKVDTNKMQAWNSFVDYVDKRGYKGSTDLDRKDKSLGQSLVNDFNKENPNLLLAYEDIQPIQEQLQKVREYNISRIKAGKLGVNGNPGSNFENFMPGISKPDGWLGSKTTSYKFPKEYMTSEEYLGSKLISSTTKDLGYVASSATMKDGGWISKAVNPKHKGYCTPMTKKTCTPKRKALARTFKKHHGFHDAGGSEQSNRSLFEPENQIDIAQSMAQPLTWENVTAHDYNQTLPEGQKIAKDPFDWVTTTEYGLLGVDYLANRLASKPKTNNIPQINSYNPYPQGTGSQAIMKYGGKMSNCADCGMKMDNGGSMTKISSPDESNPMFKFNGKSHEEGGIKFNYNGRNVEVEGGETAYLDNGGNFNIFGNMRVPGMKMNFDTAGERLAEKERKYTKAKYKGVGLVNDADLNSKDINEQAKFNAGKVMLKSNEQAEKRVGEQKENLVALQNAMLQFADDHGQDPKELFGDGGLNIKRLSPYDADRPMPDDPYKLNTKIARFDAGGKVSDSDKQKVIDAREKAAKTKSKQDILNFQRLFHQFYPDQATEVLNDYPTTKYGTNTKNYRPDLRSNEDGLWGPRTERYVAKSRSLDNSNTPIKSNIPIKDYQAPDLTKLRPSFSPQDGTGQVYNTNPLQDFKKPSNLEDTPLGNDIAVSQIFPELYSLATNRQQPVKSKYITPELYSPYTVSFQDLRNENQADYNSQVKQLVDNGREDLIPALAAQKYRANESQTVGQEFRTNQAIANDTYNKNISLINQANYTNAQIADQQFQREELARANTEDRTFGALSSISSKVAQNSLETKTANLYSQLFKNYKYNNNTGKVEFDPNSVQGDIFTGPNGESYSSNMDSKNTQYYYDSKGRRVGKTETEPMYRQRKARWNLFK